MKRTKQVFRLEDYTLTEEGGKVLLWHERLAGAIPVENHHLVNLFKRLVREVWDKPVTP